MWVCGKSKFWLRITLWHQNEEIVCFSPYSTINLSALKFWETFTMRNALSPIVFRSQGGLLFPRGALPQPQLNQFPAILIL
jgi:hypothetical protein